LPILSNGSTATSTLRERQRKVTAPNPALRPTLRPATQTRLGALRPSHHPSFQDDPLTHSTDIHNTLVVKYLQVEAYLQSPLAGRSELSYTPQRLFADMFRQKAQIEEESEEWQITQFGTIASVMSGSQSPKMAST